MPNQKDVLREILETVPATKAALARQSGLSTEALRQAAEGQITLTDESVDRIVTTLDGWSELCRRLATALSRTKKS